MKETKKSIINDGSTYEIVCEEECDDIMDDDVITSEFTEESFDIADYIDDENIEFTDVGSKKNCWQMLTLMKFRSATIRF